MRLALVLEESPKLVVAFNFFQEGAKACMAIVEEELSLDAAQARELAKKLDRYVLDTFGLYYQRCQERKAAALRDEMPVETATPSAA